MHSYGRNARRSNRPPSRPDLPAERPAHRFSLPSGRPVSSKGGGGFHGPRPCYPRALLSRLPAGLLLVGVFHATPAQILALGAAALAAVLPACGGTQSPSEPAADLGRRAPTFTLPSASGSRVALSDFTGKPVLLYFSMGPG
jgi:hypothetical protein